MTPYEQGYYHTLEKLGGTGSRLTAIENFLKLRMPKTYGHLNTGLDRLSERVIKKFMASLPKEIELMKQRGVLK